MQIKILFFSVASFVLVFLAGLSNLTAEGTRFFSLESFGQFLDGNPESTAVTEEGAITLPPATQEWFSDPAAVFSAATNYGDEVLLARADDGQVLTVSSSGAVRNIYKSKDGLVTSILASGRSIFIAVGSPSKIFRLDERGAATLFCEPKVGFVWALAEGPKGVILAATGEPGQVLSIDAKGTASVIFNSDQTHIRSLFYSPELGIFAGGGQHGVVYRSLDQKTFKALYDSSHIEITALVTRGVYVYAAGVSGAEALASAGSGEEKGKKGPEVRSQLAQVAMDGSSEIIAGSNDEAIFALALDQHKRILVATGATGRDDPRGRIYAVEPKLREIALLYQAPSRRITHLCALKDSSLALVAADGGRVIKLGSELALKGEFFTLPFDTGINSKFGSADLLGDVPQGTEVSIAVRSGQTSHPDDSWSDWSKEIVNPSWQSAQVESGRYLQARITLKGGKKLSPKVYRLRLAYLRQNLPPFVREVSVLRKGLALMALPAEQTKSKTISLIEKADKEPNRSEDPDKVAIRPAQARQVEEVGALTVKWSAEDPNGDELVFDLYFRRVGQSNWNLLSKRLEVPFYTLQAAQLPDGHYQFQVKASDTLANPEGLELSDTRESRAVLVDNTPPGIDELVATVTGRRVVIRTVVADGVGPIAKADYSVDGQLFRPQLPDDGMLDGAGESFTLRLGELEPGQHSVTFRVSDEASNQSVGETQFLVR